MSRRLKHNPIGPELAGHFIQGLGAGAGVSIARRVVSKVIPEEEAAAAVSAGNPPNNENDLEEEIEMPNESTKKKRGRPPGPKLARPSFVVAVFRGKKPVGVAGFPSKDEARDYAHGARPGLFSGIKLKIISFPEWLGRGYERVPTFNPERGDIMASGKKNPRFAPGELIRISDPIGVTKLVAVEKGKSGFLGLIGGTPTRYRVRLPAEMGGGTALVKAGAIGAMNPLGVDMCPACANPIRGSKKGTFKCSGCGVRLRKV